LLAIPTIAVLILHQGPLQVGLLGALRFAPFLVLAPIVGPIADRYPRRSLMIVADLGRTVTLAMVPLLYELHALNIWGLYAVAAVAGCLTVLFEVSYQAYLPSFIPMDTLVEGNTKLQISRSVAQPVGSAIAAGLVAVMSAALAVIGDALTFLVSVVAVFRIQTRETPQGKRRPAIRAGAREGWAYLLRHELLRNLLAASSVPNLGYSMGSALALVLAYKELHLAAWVVGLGIAAGGAGFVLGALAVRPVMAKLTPGRTLGLMPALSGVGYVLMTTGHWGVAFLGFAVGQFVVGWATSVYNIPVITLVQTQTPPQMRGRIMGSALILVWGASAVGYAVGGLIGDGLAHAGRHADRRRDHRHRVRSGRCWRRARLRCARPP
jgi:MFS family permease